MRGVGLSKTLVVVALVAVFVLTDGFSTSGFSAVDGDVEEHELEFLTMVFCFSNPVVSVDDEKVRVCVDEASHYLIYPSKPVLPVNVSVVKFGFGTK
ncbi:MAG TPA: hypothetical protein ENI42_07505, partial [Thermoplasmatales archaeon]|nr:hypothetical protein [Thermoplasmatales archaeon]